MNLLDKAIASMTPTPSDEDIQEARAKARAAAGTTGWLAMIIGHHEQIESAFAAVKGAGSAGARQSAQKRLALILTGHSIAEESVIYPAMALGDQERHADEAYKEQAHAKVQMAALDKLDPMSDDYLDKLEKIRGAIAHHVMEEEGEYFPKLRKSVDPATQGKLTRRYQEEYERYVTTGD
jgi:hypothetical protein